jgi:hypothetical protein
MVLYPNPRLRQNSAMESPLPSNSRSNATRRFSAEILRIPHPDTLNFRRTIFQTGKDQPLTMLLQRTLKLAKIFTDDFDDQIGRLLKQMRQA